MQSNCWLNSAVEALAQPSHPLTHREQILYTNFELALVTKLFSLKRLSPKNLPLEVRVKPPLHCQRPGMSEILTKI